MKIRTVEILERNKGKFVQTEIPEGSWIAVFKSLNAAVPTNEMKPALPLPKELMVASGSGDGRERICEHIRKEWVATVSNDPITPQWYVLGCIPRCNDADDGDYPEYHGRSHWQYALVADKPFGVICWQNCDYYHDHYDLDWEDFVVAGRVTGDKITKGPGVRHPMFLKEVGNDVRPKWRWTRLSELAKSLGEDPMKLWEFYFHIGVGSSRVIIGRIEHTVLICRGDEPAHCNETHDDEGRSHRKVPPPLHSSEFQPPYSFTFSREQWAERMEDLKRNSDPTKIWVPAGWAMTACYLHHFGFKPAKVEQLV